MKRNQFLVLGFLFVLSQMYQVRCSKIFHEWSRKFSGFLGETPFAKQFLQKGEPPTTVQLIKYQGYPAETHYAKTEDGYILEMHRIPWGIRPKIKHRFHQRARVPVILLHGRHVTLSSTDARFWDYSVHEMGVYDLAVMIDYVLAKTSFTKLHFIGFSLGDAALMVLLSKRPEYNQKVSVGVLMAPGGIYYDGFLFGLAKLVSQASSLYELFSNRLGGIPAIPPAVTNLLHRVLPIICHRKVDWIGVCIKALYTMFGNDLGLISKGKMPLITSVAPAPFSVRTIIHGIQQAGLGDFTEYDYGITKNLIVYGRSRPPAYNLTNIIAPISIMVGPRDFFASPRDAQLLAKRLPNVVELYRVKCPFFRHLDFCYGRGAGKLVYQKVVNTLNKFSPIIFVRPG